MKNHLLEAHLVTSQTLGFFQKFPKKTIVYIIESSLSKEHIKDYFIKDIIMNNGDLIIEYEKRIIPLTDEQYNKKYKE